MTKQRTFIAALTAIGCFSIFQPWMTFQMMEINGFQSNEGKLAFLCFCVAGVLTFIPNSIKENLNKNPQIAIAILAMVTSASGLTFYMSLRAASKLMENAMAFVPTGGTSNLETQPSASFSLGYGAILTILCGLSIFFISIAFNNKKTVEPLHTENTES